MRICVRKLVFGVSLRGPETQNVHISVCDHVSRSSKAFSHRSTKIHSNMFDQVLYDIRYVGK